MKKLVVLGMGLCVALAFSSVRRCEPFFISYKLCTKAATSHISSDFATHTIFESGKW